MYKIAVMLATLACLLLSAVVVQARPITVATGPVIFGPPQGAGLPPFPGACDVATANVNHELGSAQTFSAMESISWSSTTTSTSACQAFDQATSNTLVTITNNTGHFWDNLWFVADAQLISLPAGGNIPVLTNADAEMMETSPLAGGSLGAAFLIDNLGVNQPLIGESQANDLIFAPNETWTFVVQDWGTNLPIQPGAGCGAAIGQVNFGSPGVGGISCNNANSNASIVARLVTVPEPMALALFGMGLLGLGAARRREKAAV